MPRISDAIICPTPGPDSALFISAELAADPMLVELELEPDMEEPVEEPVAEPCAPVAPLFMPGVLPRSVSVVLGPEDDGAEEDGAEEGGDVVPGDVPVCAMAGAASRVVAKR